MTHPTAAKSVERVHMADVIVDGRRFLFLSNPGRKWIQATANARASKARDEFGLERK